MQKKAVVIVFSDAARILSIPRSWRNPGWTRDTLGPLEEADVAVVNTWVHRVGEAGVHRRDSRDSDHERYRLSALVVAGCPGQR